MLLARLVTSLLIQLFIIPLGKFAVTFSVEATEWNYRESNFIGAVFVELKGARAEISNLRYLNRLFEAPHAWASKVFEGVKETEFLILMSTRDGSSLEQFLSRFLADFTLAMAAEE